jgi:phosphomannomutase
VVDYANAFHKFLGNGGSIVIGRDGRPSGSWIEGVLVKELTLLGHDVLLLGVVPTPTVQINITAHNAVGGIAITASHNPSNWNGLKFLNGDGLFLNSGDNERLWSLLNEPASLVNNIGEVIEVEDPIDMHIDQVINVPYIANEIANIRFRLNKMNAVFVIDAVNAGGSVAVPRLLKRLGCKYEELYCDGTGDFPHIPEPIKENLTALCNYIKKKNIEKSKNEDKNVYMGIAVDPDADRLVLVDENGELLCEEETVCIAIDSYYTLNNDGMKIAVVNQSTTMLADAVASIYGGRIERSPVGEINVVQKMQQTGAIIGGEGSGGVILADCHYGRDSLVGIALTLAILARLGATLFTLSDNYPKYAMIKCKKEFDGNREELYSKIGEIFPQSRISLIDGIKITYSNAWVHLRASNTEPIIRVIAESSTYNRAEGLANDVLEMI